MKVLLTLCTVAFFAVAGCANNQVQLSGFKRADKKVGKFTKHMEESLFQITDNGLYSVEVILFVQNLKVGRNAFYVAIHDSADEDVSEAKLDITAYMAQGDLEAKPGIEASKPGLYDVNSLVLRKAGHWDLLVEIEKGGNTDKTVFSFPNVQ